MQKQFLRIITLFLACIYSQNTFAAGGFAGPQLTQQSEFCKYYTELAHQNYLELAQTTDALASAVLGTKNHGSSKSKSQLEKLMKDLSFHYGRTVVFHFQRGIKFEKGAESLKQLDRALMTVWDESTKVESKDVQTKTLQNALEVTQKSSRLHAELWNLQSPDSGATLFCSLNIKEQNEKIFEGLFQAIPNGQRLRLKYADAQSEGQTESLRAVYFGRGNNDSAASFVNIIKTLDATLAENIALKLRNTPDRASLVPLLDKAAKLLGLKVNWTSLEQAPI